MAEGFKHTPVLLNEVIDALVLHEGVYVDATLGGGGHAEGFLKRLDEKGLLKDSVVLGIDQDAQAIAAAKARLACYEKHIEFFEQNFSGLDRVVQPNSCRVILMDLGVSSYQIDTPHRGFSFQKEGQLDMRMSLSCSLTAEDIVNTYSEQELADIIYQYGQERKSRIIAKRILRHRANRDITNTLELEAVVLEAIGAQSPVIRKKTLARVFQAIRIEVNREMEVLEKGLESGFQALLPGGRLGVISYHSLEDRMVKTFFKELAEADWGPKGLPIKEPLKPAKAKLVTRKPIVPSERELSENRRARSAKFRVIEKI